MRPGLIVRLTGDVLAHRFGFPEAITLSAGQEYVVIPWDPDQPRARSASRLIEWHDGYAVPGRGIFVANILGACEVLSIEGPK